MGRRAWYDKKKEWVVTETGKRTVVVFVGDMIDDDRGRGFVNGTPHHEFRIFALIHTLRAKGLDIITMLGNHEAIQMRLSSEKTRTDYRANRSRVIQDEEAERRGVSPEAYQQDPLYRTGWEPRGVGYMNRFVQLCHGTPAAILRLGRYIFCHGGVTHKTVDLMKKMASMVRKDAALNSRLGLELAPEPTTDNNNNESWLAYGDSLLAMVNALARGVLLENNQMPASRIKPCCSFMTSFWVKTGS